MDRKTRTTETLNKLVQLFESGTIAELAAACIGEMYGFTHHGFSQKYIEHWAEKGGTDPGRACAAVIGHVEKVLNYIIEKAEALTHDATTADAA